MGVPVGEKPPAPQVAEVFLQAPQRPRAIRAEPEDVAADLRRLVADAVRFGKQVGVDEPDEMGEAVVVAVVRGRGEQQEVVGVGGQPLGDLVSLGLFRFVAAPGTALGVGAALVRLVDDDEIPPLAPDPLAHIVLLGVVERGNDLRGAVPGIDELLLIDGREDDVERLAEPAEQFVLPLDGERRGQRIRTRSMASRSFISLMSRPAMIVLPAPGSSASRKRSRGWGASAGRRPRSGAAACGCPTG